MKIVSKLLCLIWAITLLVMLNVALPIGASGMSVSSIVYGKQMQGSIAYDGASVLGCDDYDASSTPHINENASRMLGADGIFAKFFDFLAAEGTAAAGDHIVLGLESQGLQQTATQVGGRTLMTDANWQATLQTSLGNPSTRFTVSLDGVTGTSPYSQFMGAAQQGLGSGAVQGNWFNWGQIYQAGRQGSVTFMQGGSVGAPASLQGRELQEATFGTEFGKLAKNLLFI